ncbi:PIG-L family deacetylase [Shewanella sp. YLB-07]|nr:PIG-L family deacetylase [Shewanella sp. YLB-07]
MLFFALVCSCQSTQEINGMDTPSVIILLAHPDDETWVSGTLAKLADCGVRVFPVYATSGDAGSDHSGQGLSGADLARVREQEAIAASSILGLEPPIFLRFPDGKLTNFHHQLIATFEFIVTQIDPIAVMSFIRGGITDNRDHKTVNRLITGEFNENSIYFALSDTRADILSRSAEKFGLDYRVTVPVDDSEISILVDVSPYARQRISAMSIYTTQFPPTMISAFSAFVERSTVEELVIVDGVELPHQLLYLLRF